MMPGQFEQITAFLAVAKAQSFSRAAEALGQSPSSVTRTLAELEARLGVQLLVRTTRKVSLTQAGAAYAAQMQPLLSDVARSEDQVRTYQTSLSGTLRISAPLSFGLHALTAPLTQFRADNPDIDLVVSLTDHFVDIVTENLDMALRISGVPSDRSTIWRKIAAVPRIMVASPAYIAGHGQPVGPQDLHHHDCLSYAHLADGDTWQLTDAKTSVTQPTRVPTGFTCDNGDLLAKMAVADQGITVLPAFLLRDHIAAGRLVQLLPDWQLPDIWLTAFYPPYQRLPAAVERFTACIEDAIGDTPI